MLPTQIPQPLRYLLVGVFLFLLDYGITWLIYVTLQQPLLLAQWVGRFTGAAAGYIMHGRYTFGTAPQSSQPRRLRYWLVAMALWVVSPGVLGIAMMLVPSSFLVAKAVTEFVLIGASYLLLRHVVFQNNLAPE